MFLFFNLCNSASGRTLRLRSFCTPPVRVVYRIHSNTPNPRICSAKKTNTSKTKNPFVILSIGATPHNGKALRGDSNDQARGDRHHIEGLAETPIKDLKVCTGGEGQPIKNPRRGQKVKNNVVHLKDHKHDKGSEAPDLYRPALLLIEIMLSWEGPNRHTSKIKKGGYVVRKRIIAVSY